MPYQILIEEQRSRQQHFELRTEILPDVHGSVETAQRVAYRLAYDHVPKHPRVLKGRTVFRASPNHYIVRVQGMTGQFGFTVRVCEQLPEAG